MTRKQYENEYDAIDGDYPDKDDGSISILITRANAANLRIMVCQKYITSLEARIAELEAENARLNSALERAVEEMPGCPTQELCAQDCGVKHCATCWREWLMREEI